MLVLMMLLATAMASCTPTRCFIDADGDGQAPCPRPHRHHRTKCLVYCLDDDERCPHGYVSLEHAHFERRHAGTPTRECTAEEARVPLDRCDCCDADALVHINSTTYANAANACGSLDYNCDGRVDRRACCVHGRRVDDRRFAWPESLCRVDDGPLTHRCGSCASPSGFVCADCDDAELLHADDACPNACFGRSSCVGSGGTVDVGTCARMYESCARRANGGWSLERERCCVVAVQ